MEVTEAEQSRSSNSDNGRGHLLLLSLRLHTLFPGLGRRRSRGLEGLLEIGDDVVDVLRADGDPDEVVGHARAGLLLVRKLLVRRRPGVDGQRLGVAHVGQVGDELEAVDDLAPRLAAPLDAEAEDAAEPPLEVPLRQLVAWVAFQARVRHPADVGARLQVASQGQGVLGVSLPAQAERLKAQNELLRGEGADAGAQVPQDLDPRADDEGDGPEGLPELEAVVPSRRLDHLWEPLCVLAPVEFAGVDHDTADRGAVTSDPLGCRVDDD